MEDITRHTPAPLKGTLTAEKCPQTTKSASISQTCEDGRRIMENISCRPPAPLKSTLIPEKRHASLANFFVGMPTFVWLVVFYALPVLIMFVLAFKPVNSRGGIGDGWTLQTIRELGDPSYPAIIWRTIWQSVVSTAISIIIAVPISYQLARMNKRMRNLCLLLIVVPFWTNFLIRIYTWKVFLHPQGAFKYILVQLGLADSNTTLLYNKWAVLAVMVYTYLPYAILPIYAVAEKFDFSLLEAAKDLGASSFYGFRRVFLPSIANGIWVAVMVVLIPALGAYLIPSIVGGPTSQLLGDKIYERAINNMNRPHASALSALLMLGVFLPFLIGFTVQKIRKCVARKAGPLDGEATK